ncbi:MULTISPECIES: hypothetical protein [Methylomonas]|uniref:Esterase n=2 Tax=Methylomonas TaxID=416 RepID=A0A140E3L6_9GAMM|nr:MULTISPECIES: hypothetical protein [Methylomonas]AMK74990.1 hypothetical protein JT25_000560 [Methylomonas denitrificans]OAI02488.1 hypothetical protein A1342_01560 [Methylomonas methanica]TCV83198.1 hypothetical protein EDE11_110157 [Methylomonas methanica]
MNRLLFAMLLLLSACAPKEYFRTEIRTTPCLANAGADCSAANLVVNPQDDYTLGFVEFDDDGRFYDQRQADALLKCLQDSKQPQYVVLYTHGWHHNAKDSDNNVRRFKESLRDIKLRNPQYRVIGVYLGWRGETVETPWLRALTFWGRRAVSEQLGQKQFLDFLLNVETVVKHDADPDNRLLTIGHSLGASVILNALQPVWMQRLQQGRGDQARFGDLVLLVNPAVEARRFADLRAVVRRVAATKHLEHTNPLVVVASSEADNITKNMFTYSRAVPAWFESVLDPAEQVDMQGASQWDLAATAVGHFRGFITHRLEVTATTSTNQACTVDTSGGINTLPNALTLTGPEGIMASAVVWRVADGLQLRPVAEVPMDDPLWVVQTDKYVLPNHGFMAQKPFWCFIEGALSLAASHG